MSSTMADHGVTFRSLPTSVISPVIATSGINTVVGTAPTHIRDTWRNTLNRPVLINNYEEFVELFGYSPNYGLYTLCEHADSAFRAFGTRPHVYIQVQDNDLHIVPDVTNTVVLVNGAVTTVPDIVITSLVVRSAAGADPYDRDVDYILTWTRDLRLIITRISTGAIPAPDSPLHLTYNRVDHDLIDSGDIAGGVDINTGQRTGIEAIEDVFSLTGVLPGFLLAPRYSDDPIIAALLETKAQDINGCFKTRCGIDVAPTVRMLMDVLPWKTQNNIVSPRQIVCWPHLAISEQGRFHMTSELGPLLMYTDATRGGNVPYVSPSNKPIKTIGTVLADGTPITLSKDQCNQLNRWGVFTALNWGVYGWKGWGNRTAAGGGQSPDIKDKFIPNARMEDFLGNTFVLTLHAYVDEPGNRRLIDLVVNSFNRWLNSLQAQGALLGGRIEFRHDENPTDQLLDGHYVFHTFYLSPPPAEWIEGLFEVDVNYFDNLFEEAA